MRWLFVYCICVFVASKGMAQQVRPAPSNKIYGKLGRLKHTAKVLYIAAHPDDENTRLLAWLVNKKHINAAYLSLTRGDGGQNILGTEQGAALGLIRTYELLEARKIDGAGQFFTSAVDFGFSKTYQETFEHWNRETLVKDAVEIIRKYKPDVVICRFPPDTLAGHGHHAASAVVARDAFELAGNPDAYNKDDLQRIPAWQPKRLLWNTFKFGSSNTTSEDQLKIPVGQYLPEWGMGVGELAGISRSIHKSQGAGTPSIPGVQYEYFKHVAGSPCKASLFDSIDITWDRVNRPDIDEDIADIMQNFDHQHPDHSLPALLQLHTKMQNMAESDLQKEKLAALEDIIFDCAGFMAELYTNEPTAVAGNTLKCTLKMVARSKTPVMAKRLLYGDTSYTFEKNLLADSLSTIELGMKVPLNTLSTAPYWLHPIYGAYSAFKGLPTAPPVLSATLLVKIGNTALKKTIPISYKKLEPLKGDVVEALRIVPEHTISLNNNLLITKNKGKISVMMRFLNYDKQTKATQWEWYMPISADNTQLFSPSQGKVSCLRDTQVNLTLNPVWNDATMKRNITLYLQIRASGINYTENLMELHTLKYDHIPTLQYFTRPTLTIVYNDWKCTAKRIGYVPGAGDNIVELLTQCGLKVDVLTEKDFSDKKNLLKYDAIITGYRCLNVERSMAGRMPLLLDYAKQGGTLLMLYNTTVDLATKQIGPYPITLSNKRVAEEDAQVVFTNKQARLLNYPNKITPADFENWQQERGLNFPLQWDSLYSTMLSMHDKGEAPLTSSILYTRYGKGHYIYTSLAFHRQLPTGNKGAIRLLMNMLSVGK